MAKQSRYQSVVNRHSDEEYSENHWLKEFENKLQKTSVQPRGNSLFEQITSIMNTKSKYPSVQAAVDDMMQRSGLTSYLENVKVSEEAPKDQPRKTAQDESSAKLNENPHTPDVIKQKASILRTLENIVKESKGNLPVPAVIARLRSLHARDISDEGAWDDEKLVRLVSRCNLRAKKDNPGTFDKFDDLGRSDHFATESDIDASNTDAFNALMPAKI